MFFCCCAPKRPSNKSTQATSVEQRTVPTKRVKQSKQQLSTLSSNSIPMNKLTSSQRAKVESFVQCTEASQNIAIKALEVAAWKVDFAIELYFQDPSQFVDTATIGVDHNMIRATFDQYANDPKDETTSEKIGPNGLMRLLKDMHLDPLDRRVLILACKLKAAAQCEFTWDEWEKGLSSLGVNDINALREKLDELDSNMTDRAAFSELYKFVFDYGRQAGQKFLQLEYALQYWRILFKDLFPLLGLWEEFLNTQHGRGITKDTWCLLLEFCYTVNADLTNYDCEGAWPVLLDQFVEYAKSKQVQTAA